MKLSNIDRQMINRPFEVTMHDVDVVLILNKCRDVDRVPRGIKLQMQADLTNKHAFSAYCVMTDIVESLVRH